MEKKHYYRLQGYFFSHHIRLEDVSDVLCMCRTTLYNKLNGITPFKQREIDKLKDVYGLSDYFFRG